MNIDVSLPLDSDGFLRRECPHCMQQFKWHSGPANEEAERHASPPAYHCPLCGQPAGHDSWWTQEQLDYIQAASAPAVTRFIDDQVGKMLKSMKSKHFKIKQTGHMREPDHPNPLVEADDMVIVASPCHAYEPVKIPDQHHSPLHCLVCGSAFAI